MASDVTVETSFLLSGTAADELQHRLTQRMIFVSTLIFLVGAVFAKVQLPAVWAFIPIYETALVVTSLTTAILLFGQFHILGSRRLCFLACGYLFEACMAVPHMLTFPGLFAPAGLIGAGPQSTAWLYMFWHAGFPLGVLAYAWPGRDESDAPGRAGRTRLAVMAAIAAVLALTLALALLTTLGQNLLPPIMRGNNYTPAMIVVVGSVWAANLAALIVVWRRRRCLLDEWLLVVMCAWVFDIALSAMLNQGRFDLGFYAGRVYGLLAASFVLMALLLENTVLYARLVDTTGQLRLRGEEIERKNRQVEEASRAKSDFLANMSHEFRTPLNTMIGFAQVLEDRLYGPLNEKQAGYAARILKSAHHLLRLVNDILDLSKVESGKMPLELAELDVGALIEDVLVLQQEVAVKRGIALVADAEAARGVITVADERKLKQILFNLISNALKFTPAGGTVTVAAGPSPDDHGGRLLFAVTDTGIGIAKDDQIKLFQEFSQVESPYSRNHEGTGLGLALCRKLVALHGGEIGLDSEPDRGSRFFFTLPLRRDAATGEPARDKRRAGP